MPYYVFSITQSNPMIKQLDLKGTHETYQEARQQTRDLRANANPAEQSSYKLIFAATQLEAEERLQEPREKPILMEWEK